MLILLVMMGPLHVNREALCRILDGGGTRSRVHDLGETGCLSRSRHLRSGPV